eukprot:TRINITY_DN6496_c0_g2_i3.p1 TRINITY_DN6496_c0_g2~~TRINITY_DN6496_c0_g2_i3.p1  ORF type:complete len:699 (+),score=210.48 TRINITY_DN6496_c0_g2_i3:55-2097(+)
MASRRAREALAAWAEENAPLESSRLRWAAWRAAKEGPLPPAVLRYLSRAVAAAPSLSPAAACGVVHALTASDCSDARVALAAAAQHLRSDSSGELTASDVCLGLYGLRNREPAAEMRSVLTAMREAVARRDVKLRGSDAALAVYGLRQGEATREAAALLRTLATRFDVQAPLSDAEVVMVVAGVRNQACAGLAALAALADGIASGRHRFDSRTVAGVLGGLREHVDCAEARVLLTALLPRVPPRSVRGSDLATALHGLRRLHGSPVTAAIVRRLQGSLEGVAELSSRDLAKALLGIAQADTAAVAGLQSMLSLRAAQCAKAASGPAPMPADVALGLYALVDHAASPPYRRIQASLAAFAAACTEPFSPRDVGTALYGLSRCEDGPVTRRVLATVAAQLLRVTGPADGASAGNALFGLRTQHIHSAELCELLGAMAEWLRRGVVLPATEQHVTNCLYGLNGVGDSDAGRAVLAAIVPVVLRHPGRFSPFAFAMGAYGLRTQPCAAEARSCIQALLRCAPDSFLERDVPRTLAMVLTGIRGQGGTPEADAVLSMLPVPREPMHSTSSAAALHGLLSLSAKGTDTAPMLAAILPCVPADPQNPALQQALYLIGAPLQPLAEGGASLKPACVRERLLKKTLEAAGIPGDPPPLPPPRPSTACASTCCTAQGSSSTSSAVTQSSA